MENKKIDFVVHEADMNRADRDNKRLFTLCIVLIIALFITFISIILYSLTPSENYENIVQETDGTNVTQNIGS